MEGDYNYICGGSSVEKVVLFSTRVKSAQCTRKVVPAYSKTALGGVEVQLSKPDTSVVSIE